MAEGFGPYHVPQQNRRDKLRILAQNLEPSLQGLLPLYDSSILPSDLLTCAAAANPVHASASGSNDGNSSVCLVKQEGRAPNFMGPYLDPNPSTLQPIHPNPFFYNLHSFRDLDQAYSNGGLSLSLSSHDSHQSSLPLELNLQRYGPAVFAVPTVVGPSGSAPDEVSRSSVPLGPFTGYSLVLKGSRFLKPAQQLLEEFCDVGRTIYAEKIGSNSDASSLMESFSAGGIIQDDAFAGDVAPESQRKKSKLLSMLEEVYQRYKQYYQQMQAVVASFECVAGLGNAAPYAILSVRAMSKHFRCLKNAILDQLQFTNKNHGQVSPGKNEVPRFGSTDKGPYGQRPFADHQPVWRPQRGLPERAVTVLRAWLFDHFLHPYPTDTDKIMLAKQTGLSRSQVSNWFINARVRLWKPMVEEIHMLETKQAQKVSQKDQNWEANKSSDHLSSTNSLLSENPSTSTQRIHDAASKRSRSELPDLPEGSRPPHLSYTSLASHPHIDVGSSLPAGSSSGVSLTLGLHQNNGITMAEPPFSMNTAQRFGIGMEGTSEGYVMGGFEAQNRHFGAVHLLHDFVG